MVFITFSASGTSFAAAEFLAANPIRGGAAWRKGERRRSGKVHRDSGIRINLRDAQTPAAAVALVKAFLRTNRQWLKKLKGRNVSSHLDLGVTVGEKTSFAPSLVFEPEFLSLLVERNIALEVSCYPTSDET